MSPSTALTASQGDLQAYVGTLDEPQLVAFFTAMDAAEVELRRSKSHHLPSSALYYVTTVGWPVFPLLPRGKRPLTTNGFKDATLDPAVVQAWWTRWPTANIGTPTGRREQGGCGLDVIDVDGPAGYASLADLRHSACAVDCCAVAVCGARGPLPPSVAQSRTPGDHTSTPPRPPGTHVFSLAAGSCCATRVLPGIDVRGDGGYVVLPPSVGPDGDRYAWMNYPSVGVAG